MEFHLGDPNDARSVSGDYETVIKTNCCVPDSIPNAARDAVAEVYAEAMEASNHGDGLLIQLMPTLILNKPQRGNKRETFVRRVIRHCEQFKSRDFRSLFDDLKQATCKKRPFRDMSKVELAQKKVQWGRVSAAMNVLKSEGLADPSDPNVFERVQEKCPEGPKIPIPNDLPSSDSLHISVKDAKELIGGLERGLSAGPSRMSNEMIKETCMRKSPAGIRALHAFMTYTNRFIDGAFDQDQAPYINSARLAAKVKGVSDERPLAVGEALRRSTCSYVASKVGKQAAEYFSPLQVGFKVQGGAEATARGLTMMYHKHKRSRNVATLSIDGKNAFNVIDRERMLNQIREKFPSLARIAYFLYSGPAKLYFGEKVILSLSGTHQGCPLGGLFFAIGLHPLLREIKVRISGGDSEVRGDNDPLLLETSYYDNIYIMVDDKDRTVPIILEIIDKEIGKLIGYERGKNCFIVCPAEPLYAETDALDIDGTASQATTGAPRTLFGLPLKHNYVALGYPIGDDNFIRTWLTGDDGTGGKLAKLMKIADLVDSLADSQSQLYLLTRSLVHHTPYLTRILPRAQVEPLLQRFELRIRRSVANIAGRSDLPDQSWRQAKLPYKLSGLQLQDPLLIADAAQLGSTSSFAALTTSIIRKPRSTTERINLHHFIYDADEVVSRYNAAAGTNYESHAFPAGFSQKVLAEPIYEREAAAFIETLDAESRARVLSCSSIKSSAHFFAVPNHFFGTKIPTHLFEPIVQFRLGAVAGSPTCSYCGHLNDANGTHQTTCQRSGLAHIRHDNVRNALTSAVHTAGIMVENETPNLIPGSNSRPGDLVCHNFTSPGPVPFDVTIVSPTCPTHLARGQEFGAVANQADDQKRQRYEGTLVHPLSFESHGLPSRGSNWFIKRVADRMVEFNADLSLEKLKVLAQRLYLFQKIAIALQTGNARMILLCGNRRAAIQDSTRPSDTAPLLDMTNVEWRELQ